jgi:quercetin 2,3-dioxygenase
LAINQYAFITLGLWDQQTSYNLHTKSNGVFLLCIDGSATIAGYTLKKRDAIEVTDMSEITITPHMETQILVVEVPMGK